MGRKPKVAEPKERREVNITADTPEEWFKLASKAGVLVDCKVREMRMHKKHCEYLKYHPHKKHQNTTDQQTEFNILLKIKNVCHQCPAYLEAIDI